MALLECSHIHKSYGPLKALNDVSCSIEPNRIAGLLGPNGQGKSTLIKSILGLVCPDQGEILLDGRPMNPTLNSQIAYLPEQAALDTNQSVEQALKFTESFYSNFDLKKAREMLDQLKIDPKAKIKTLSKGNQEKLQLILVMARNARLYILDEPLGGVDPASRDYILDTILSRFQEGSSILISTHLIADIERILDDVIFLQNGQIIEQEEADALRDKEQCSIDTLFRRKFSCL